MGTMPKASSRPRDAKIKVSGGPRKRVKPPRQEPGSDEEPSPNAGKRKREDVSQRKQERRLHRQYVVKASLGGSLSVFLSEDVRDAFREVVDEYVSSISQMLVMGSLVANETILEMFRRGQDVKIGDYLFFRRAMTGNARGHPVMRDVLEASFADTDIERSQGDWASLNFASQQFYTNFDNALWMSFIPRYVGFVTDYANRFDFDLPRVVASIIFGFRHHVHCALDRNAWEFIEQQRQYFGNPEYFVPERADGDLLLRMLYRILDFRFAYGLSGGFSLVPLSKIKRHHITIDTTALYLILSRIFAKLGERTPRWMQEVVLLEQKQAIHVYRDMMWGMMFDNFSGLSSGEFIHMISTDGMAVSVNFQRPRREPTGGSPAELDQSQRRIAFDPGRHHLLVGHEVGVDGRDRWWTLSRGAYYGAIRGSIKKMAKWESSALGDVYAEWSATSIRSADPELCAAYRRVYFDNYDRLWAVKLHKRFARERFHIYSRKRSTIDKFFIGIMKQDRRRPVILYGGAALRPGGVGELSVPVKRVLQACKRFYKVIMVNEHLTTKAHSVCGSYMHPVKNRRASHQDVVKAKPIHGIKYCPTCRCFVNRDRDAAKSMHHASVDPRPEYLSFTRPYEWMQPIAAFPPKQTRLGYRIW